MNKQKLNEFINKLYDKTEDSQLSWDKMDLQDTASILKNSSSYSSIVGAYENYNPKQKKSTVIGKYKLRVFYEEDVPTNEEFVFISIVEPSNYTDAIVFNEDEFSLKTTETLNSLYRLIELKNSNVDNVIDNWFD